VSDISQRTSETTIGLNILHHVEAKRSVASTDAACRKRIDRALGAPREPLEHLAHGLLLQGGEFSEQRLMRSFERSGRLPMRP
jgi:hypothetical protein